MFESAGLMELVVILLIALVAIGAGRLPEVASSLGKGMKAFKNAASLPVEMKAIHAPEPHPAEAGTVKKFRSLAAIDRDTALPAGELAPLALQPAGPGSAETVIYAA